MRTVIVAAMLLGIAGAVKAEAAPQDEGAFVFRRICNIQPGRNDAARTLARDMDELVQRNYPGAEMTVQTGRWITGAQNIERPVDQILFSERHADPEMRQDFSEILMATTSSGPCNGSWRGSSTSSVAPRPGSGNVPGRSRRRLNGPSRSRCGRSSRRRCSPTGCTRCTARRPRWRGPTPASRCRRRSAPDGQRRSPAEIHGQLQVDDRSALEETLFQAAGGIEDLPAPAVVVLTALHGPPSFMAVQNDPQNTE